MNNSKVAVLYHHFNETNGGASNLNFFLNFGILPDVDYYFSLVNCLTGIIPEKENFIVRQYQNHDYDFGGFSKLVNEFEIAKRYKYIIFLNSTVKGPFVLGDPMQCWIQKFLQPLGGDVALSGMSISILHPSSPHAMDFFKRHGRQPVLPHVQTMAFCMASRTLSSLIDDGFFSRDLNSDRKLIISEFELLLSHRILSSGYNISCCLPMYQNIDYRTIRSDFNSHSIHGDCLFKNAYFGQTINPFTSIFVKTRRNYIDFNNLEYLYREYLCGSNQGHTNEPPSGP